MAAVKGTPMEAGVVKTLTAVAEESAARAIELATTRGLAEAEILRRVRLVAEGGGAQSPWCRAAALYTRMGARMWLPRWDDRVHDSQVNLAQTFHFWALPSDLGCLEGVPGRFASAAEVWPFVSAVANAPPPRSPTCAAAYAGLAQQMLIMDSPTWTAETLPTRDVQAYNAYLMFVAQGCGS